ncbi:MAG TPA: DMT family transporter [Gammaproteobacteria bacterium]|jgi:drug/metabolite transporter (DMT)-like permease
MRYPQNVLQGALFILLSELMFASMGAAVKAASGLGLSNEMLVFMRNLMGLFVIAPLLLRHGRGELRTPVYPLHLLRAVLGLSAMYCFFYVLGRLPLADGMLLKMTSPIFMPLIALLWLGERVSHLALLAIPIGLVGVMLVLRPGGELSAVALLGVLGGMLAAFAKVTVRRLGRTESTTRVVFYFTLNATLISAMPLAWAWQLPSPQQWALLGLMGVMGTAGQLLLTRGYAIAPAASVSPFTYFSVVFGAAYGYLFWGEVLDWLFVAGALLIAVAGVLAVRGRARKPLSPVVQTDVEAT